LPWTSGMEHPEEPLSENAIINKNDLFRERDTKKKEGIKTHAQKIDRQVYRGGTGSTLFYRIRGIGKHERGKRSRNAVFPLDRSSHKHSPWAGPCEGRGWRVNPTIRRRKRATPRRSFYKCSYLSPTVVLTWLSKGEGVGA